MARLAQIDAEHKLGINPKEVVAAAFCNWIEQEPSLDDYTLVRDFLAARKNYKFAPHLKVPLLIMARQSPELLEFVCYPEKRECPV